MALAWYVLHSKPNKEEYLYQLLISRQVETFYPTISVTPVNPRSRKIKPYFPGYLFVNLDLEQENQIPLFQWMPGATGLVSFDGRAAEVPGGLISAIKIKVAHDVSAARFERTFNPGDRIQVESGPFEGYEGIFDEHISANERVRILIELLRGNG